MRFGKMRSVAHNIAHSLDSGLGLPFGVFVTDIYEEAAKSPDGHVRVDFLTGEAVGGKFSSELKNVIGKYKDLLPELYEKGGISLDDYEKLEVHYGVDQIQQQRFVVDIESSDGRSATDFYQAGSGTKLRRTAKDQ